MRRGLSLAVIAGALAFGSIAVALSLAGTSATGPDAIGASPPGSHAAAGSMVPTSTAQPPSTAPSDPPSPNPTATPAPPAPLRPDAEGPRVVRALQAALDEMRTEAAIPGVSVSIVFPDGSTWTGVSGRADVATGKDVKADTAFSVASISKTFLAALILDLSAEGRFGLEDGLGEYLPELKLFRTVTIRQLLDHTSGLHDYFLHPRIDGSLLADRARPWGASEALGFVGKPYFPPGTGWHYSNTNYLLLGLLAERVEGRPLAEQLRARYFGPLGLKTAFYQGVERAKGPLAHGYRFTGPNRKLPPIDLADGTGVVPFRSVVTAAAGAGSVAASSVDLARWAHALYGDRATEPGTVALMLADVEQVAGYKPRVPYGLGVQVINVGRFLTYGHSGRFLGFRSVVRYLPDEDLSIAVLTNQSRADPGVIVSRLLKIVLPTPGPCGLCADPR